MCTAACLVVFSLCESSSRRTDVWCLPSVSAQKRNILVLPIPLPLLLSFTSKQNSPNLPKLPHKWLSLLCLLFLSPTESGWPKSSCDAGANDNFSVFISFFSHQHLVPFSSRLKSPFSCFYTSRCPLVGPLISLATSFSARSLKFGGSLHTVRAVSLISIPSVGGSHLDL